MNLSLMRLIGAFLLVASFAAADSIDASGSGQCAYIAHICQNSDPNVISYDGAQAGGGGVEDWFAFPLGPTTITSATISIWNPGSNTANGSGDRYFLAFVGAEAGPIFVTSFLTYSDIQNGRTLGIVSVASADTGTSGYVDFSLDSGGLAVLNTYLDSTIVLGGSIAASDSGNPTLFGGGELHTPVAYLTINADTSTPEPATTAMFGLGLTSLAGLKLRRRQEQRSFHRRT